MSNSMALVLRSAMKMTVAPRRKSLREAYAGAVTNRLTSFLSSGLQSPTNELRNELTTLRSRSRELCRNTPYGSRYLNLVAENAVGPHGPTLIPRAVMRSGAPDVDANKAITDAWWMWGRTPACTVDRSATFPAFLRQMEKLRAQDGESLARIHEGFDNGWGFALELLDPDLLDTQLNVVNSDGSPKIVMGIEVDRWLTPVAYHFLTRHPSESGYVAKEYVVLPAAQVIHRFRKLRKGQLRGVPDLAPVMTTLDQLSGYIEAALVEARTAAAKQGFIELSPDADAPDPDTTPSSKYTEASPGSIDYLGVGEKFVGWDPKSPNGNFDPFVTKGEKMVATGLNVSYMGLTGDLSENSFASSRAGMLQERDAWRIEHSDIATQVCEKIYPRWLRMATLAGKLKLASDDLTRYEAVEWRGRSWGWVDPEKDVRSGALAIAFGLSSPQEILAEQGKELADVYGDLADAKALADSLDLEIATPSDAALPVEEPEPVEPAPPDEDAAEDRKQVAEAMREVAGAVKWIAGREQPQPIVNVAAPVVNVAPAPVDVRVGGPKPGAQFVVKRNERGEVTGAAFEEPAETEV